MHRLWVGLGLVALGLMLALVGRLIPDLDFHAVTTGLIAVGIVMSGVALIERRLDDPRRIHDGD